MTAFRRKSGVLITVGALQALCFQPEPALARDMLAYIEQVGNRNVATVRQSSALAPSAAVIRQNGDGNEALISQAEGHDNIARIGIRGNRNGAPASAVGGSITQTGSYQTALVHAVGNDNGFRIDQTSGAGANLAALVQKGDGNTATASQTNASVANGPVAERRFALTASELMISGPTSPLAQQALGALLADANASLQIQMGNGNKAELVQHGQTNLAVQKQIGNDNAMSAEQYGSNNVLVHTQIGDGIVTPTITQTGGASMILTQWK